MVGSMLGRLATAGFLRCKATIYATRLAYRRYRSASEKKSKKTPFHVALEAADLDPFETGVMMFLIMDLQRMPAAQEIINKFCFYIHTRSSIQKILSKLYFLTNLDGHNSADMKTFLMGLFQAKIDSGKLDPHDTDIVTLIRDLQPICPVERNEIIRKFQLYVFKVKNYNAGGNTIPIL